MKTKTIEIYEFNELSESAQDKAIDNIRTINNDYEWWDSIYEDAKDAGIILESFDLDRNRHAKGYFRHCDGGLDCAELIVKNHGETCETYKTATVYLKDRDKLIESAPIDADGEYEDECALDNSLDDLDTDFLQSILEDYSISLQGEYEYLGSKENLLEVIACNEYTFNVNGRLEAA